MLKIYWYLNTIMPNPIYADFRLTLRFLILLDSKQVSIVEGKKASYFTELLWKSMFIG